MRQRGQTVPDEENGAEVEEAEGERQVDVPIDQGHREDEQRGNGDTEVALELR